MIKKIILIITMVISLMTINSVNIEAKTTNKESQKFANVVMFAEFSNDTDSFFESQKTRNTIMDIYNGSDGRAFTNYMETISYGQFQVENIFPQDDGKKINAYQLSMCESEVQNQDVDSMIIDEIIKNVSTMENQIFDYNEDGFIDNLTIILRGKDSDGTLSPHSTVYGENIEWGNKKIAHYNILNTNRLMESGVPERSGLVVHEFLHTLGYPDLYTKDRNSLPVSVWDIMASVSQYVNYPLAYERMYFSNWLSIDTITESQKLTLDVQDNKNGNQAYILKSPLNDNEVFVIEFRKNPHSSPNNVDTIDSKIGESGIIVYRIDKTVEGLSNKYGETGIYVFRPQFGQPGYNSESKIQTVLNAALSLESKKTSIGNADLNKTLSDGALTFSDGSNSGIVISDVSSNQGDQMTCQVTFNNDFSNNIWQNTQFKDNGNINNDKDCFMTSYENTQYLMINSDSQFKSYKYNGSDWEAFGNIFNADSHFSSQLFMSGQDLYFAYVKVSGSISQLILRKYNESSKQWDIVTTIDDFGNSFQFTSVDGEIYVVYATFDKTILGKLSSNQFKILGTYFSGLGGQPKICHIANQIYVSIRNASGNIIEVYRYNDNNLFTKVSGTTLYANDYDMISLGNKIYVSLSNSTISMAIYDGVSWSVGKASSISTSSQQLAVAQENIYIFVSPMIGSGKTAVFQYDSENDTYIKEGNDVDSASNSLNLSSSDKFLYLAYKETSQNIIRVKSKKITNDLLYLAVTPPLKISYVQGDTVKTNGLKVVAHYTNGSKNLTNDDYTLTDFGTSTVGTRTAKISYGGKTSTFSYTVNAKINQCPIISDIKITKFAGKYTITAKVTADAGIERVEFPTWTTRDDQDDLVWHQGVIDGDTVSCTIDMKEHNYETGEYMTHIYAYDKAGAIGYHAAPRVVVENKAPEITDIKVNQMDGRYTVTAKVTDGYGIERVEFPTWTTRDDQDDLVWHQGVIDGDTVSCTIDMKEHNYETGEYMTHIYAYDKAGAIGYHAAPRVVVENKAPELSEINVIDITAQGYTITCKVSDEYGLDKILFPTWTDVNGQDDLVWHEGTIFNGTATCRITIDKHNYEYGDYITHIYLYDNAGLFSYSPIAQKIIPAPSNPGWKNSNGRKYLFDNFGNYVERSRYFVIDVSKWQSNIDWDKLAKESSVDAVIMRIGYGYDMDSKVQEYVLALNRLGIPYGFYHYNTAITVTQAQQQAFNVVKYIRSIGGKPSLPVYADIEEGGNDRNQVAIARTFCETFEQNGYSAGVYANLNYWKNYLKYDSSLNRYTKWIANYGSNNGLPRSDWRPDSSFEMWQYSSKGKIPGISGNVDLNVMFE